jgi:hypothetical protein
VRTSDCDAVAQLPRLTMIGTDGEAGSEVLERP